MSADVVLGPEPLGPGHSVGAFDSGVPSLEAFLVERALGDQRAGKSRTYVVRVRDRVVGYFSLAAGSVEPRAASTRVAAGQGGQPVPVVLLGRLAVDVCWQGRGIGSALVVDALSRALAAADTIGARAVLVHALDARAREFYLRFGFEPSPVDPLHLMLLMKDIRKTLS